VEYFEIMAKNTNKRIPVKWVRDRAKAAYEKKTQCCVCGDTTDLELHHLHSVTILLDKWSQAKGYDISTDEGIVAVRDEFIDEHRVELYEQVYTLCNRHHVALHGVYGKAPRPGSEPKQAHWIEMQRAKYSSGGVVVPKQSFGSFFSEFT
jgi:5-methylcytosine-specific restriction endonuclease McrA